MEEFQYNTEVCLGSDTDSGKGVSSLEGDSDGKDAADSSRTELPAEGTLVLVLKDHADRRDGDERLERDVIEDHTGTASVWESMDNKDSEKSTEPNVVRLKEGGEGTQTSVEEVNKEHPPTTLRGGFSDDFLLLRAHEDSVKDFQGKGDGNTAASVTNQQSREVFFRVLKLTQWIIHNLS